MSAIDFTNIVDSDFPEVDRSRITPSVQDVATKCATRTVDGSGALLGKFTSATWPTDEMCWDLIQQAVEEALADMPDYLPESIYPRVRQAVVLKAACMVERSCYREQASKGTAKEHSDDYEKMLASIEMAAGGATAGRRVDSVMLRSTAAEYEPDYPLPPPRVMPKLPFPIDGNPNSEGQQ